MKKADVKTGSTYAVKVSTHVVPVRITSESPHGGWVGVNTVTGREVRIRGAQRLRRELKPALARFGPATPPTDLITPRLNPTARGIGLGYMHAWRQKEYDAGRPCTMNAFWLAHGLCPACHGRGEVNSGTQEEPDCTACGGTGLVPPACPECGAPHPTSCG
jgi:hypothetical protein